MTHEQLAEIIKPGDHPANVQLEDLKPCGRCDGVAWLGGGIHGVLGDDGEPVLTVIDEHACEKEALRYLKPMDKLWLALHPGRDGISKPHDADIHFTRAMYEAERTTRRKLHYIFASTEHGIHAGHPRYRDPVKCWKLIQVTDSIWVFVFDPPKVIAASKPVSAPEPVTVPLQEVVAAELAAAAPAAVEVVAVSAE